MLSTALHVHPREQGIEQEATLLFFYDVNTVLARPTLPPLHDTHTTPSETVAHSSYTTAQSWLQYLL